MRVIFAGGGTGGHIYPAIAIARGLKKKYENLDVLFIGTRKGLEASLVPGEGFPMLFVRARGFSRDPIKACQSLFETGSGLLQALMIVLRHKPALMVGTGGYVSAPVIFAGNILGVPTVILEQNIFPGKTTRFLSKLARKVCVSFEESRKFLPGEKVVVTGNPVREEIVARTREDGRGRLNIPGDKFCILVTGASQGARSINEGVLCALSEWKEKNWVVIHLTGEKNFDEVNEKAQPLLTGSKLDYRPLSYLSNIADAYASCDLVICRAGATTLAEITARGIPPVIIPYPYSAESHQEKNALLFSQVGAGVVIADAEAPGKIARIVTEIVENPVKLRDMAEKCGNLGKTNALDEILKVLGDFLSKGKA